MTPEMKKLLSLALAVASTTFLFVGATQAAEKFDTLGSKDLSLTGTIMDGPALPCQTSEE
jgi:hypothetical protein